MQPVISLTYSIFNYPLYRQFGVAETRSSIQRYGEYCLSHLSCAAAGFVEHQKVFRQPRQGPRVLGPVAEGRVGPYGAHSVILARLPGETPSLLLSFLIRFPADSNGLVQSPAHTPNLDNPIQYKKKVCSLRVTRSKVIHCATEKEGLLGVEFF